MNTPAVYSRVMEFRSGPQSETFYACETHRNALEEGIFNDNFFVTKDAPVEPVEPGDATCDWCREP